MAEIMNAQSIYACQLSHPPEPLSEIPRVRPFEIAFEPWVGLRRKDVFVVAVAR